MTPPKATIRAPGICLGVFLLLSHLAHGAAPAYETLRAFGDINQSVAGPAGELIEAGNGVLYGTSFRGGISNLGTIFRLDKSGSNYTVLHHFTGADGQLPVARLLLATNGLLYGSALLGGTSDWGTIFRLETNGNNFTVLQHFTAATNGGSPSALLQASDGKLYGTTERGGHTNAGAVFRVNLDGSDFTILYSFFGEFMWPDGGGPRDRLIEASDGLLYGTTEKGGSNNLGTVFRLEKSGANYAILHHFYNSTNGADPLCALLEADDGKLYGTTEGGGDFGLGTVFRLNRDGTSFERISSFSVAGRRPFGALIQAGNLMLYGTTVDGGTNDAGIVFRLAKDGSAFSVLHQFADDEADSGQPTSGLLLASDGLLYGAAQTGGPAYGGGVFRLALDGSGFTNLLFLSEKSFDALQPRSTLVLGSDGALYGTTQRGGDGDAGTVFKINRDGSGFSIVHHFDNDTGAGASPESGLVASGGLLYGTASLAGPNSHGQVFRVGENGSGFTVLHEFALTDGLQPAAPLLLASNGMLYGTTVFGGGVGNGVLFRLTTNGTGFSVLHEFGSIANDGLRPLGGLIEASDGLLYGTTPEGGVNGRGTVFKLDTSGDNYTVLHHISSAVNRPQHPRAGLLEASDGLLYGVGYDGGNSGQGGFFRLDRFGGNYEVAAFLSSFGNAGRNPEAPLVEGLDGLLYGTASSGGISNRGTVFRFAKEVGVVEVLHQFADAQEANRPRAALLGDTNGVWFGTGYNGGGPLDVGAVFTLRTPPVVLASPSHVDGRLGARPVVFTSSGGGTLPLSYQWYVNDSPIADATNATFTLPALSLADAGAYYAAISNAYGEAFSSAAVVWFTSFSAPNAVVVHGPVDWYFEIHHTTNLIAPIDWQVLAGDFLTNNPTLFVDDDAPAQPHRFYRSVLWP